jgi:hypothetical protein
MEPIIALVKRNGSGFIKAVNETMDEYRSNVGEAIKYEVVSINSKEAKITIGDTVSSHELVGENQDAKMTDFIFYLIGNAQGRQDYSSICGEVEVKKAQAVSAKTKK